MRRDDASFYETRNLSSPKFDFPAVIRILLSVLAGLLLVASAGLWYLRGVMLASEQRFRASVPIQAQITALDASPWVGFVMGSSDSDNSKPRFVPSAFYKFEVEGKTYQSSSPLTGDAFDSKEAARQAALTELKVGQTVTIHYRPDNPSESFLGLAPSPTNTKKVMTTVCAVCVVLAFGALGVRQFWKRKWATETCKVSVARGCGCFGLAAFFAMPALLMGIGCVSGSLTAIGQNDLARWKPIDALILSADVVAETTSSGKSQTVYRPSVRYSYWVGSLHTEGTLYAETSGPSYQSQSEVKHFLEQFPVGAKVTAYYNPENPGRAVLLKDHVGGKTLPLIMGLLSLGFAFVVLASAWKSVCR